MGSFPQISMNIRKSFKPPPSFVYVWCHIEFATSTVVDFLWRSQLPKNFGAGSFAAFWKIRMKVSLIDGQQFFWCHKTCAAFKFSTNAGLRFGSWILCWTSEVLENWTEVDNDRSVSKPSKPSRLVDSLKLTRSLFHWTHGITPSGDWAKSVRDDLGWRVEFGLSSEKSLKIQNMGVSENRGFSPPNHPF